MMKTFGTEPDPAVRIRRRQGKQLREVREMRDLTMDELANMVNVTPGAVSQWETGRTSPKQSHQIAIAKALNVPWSTLFGLDGEVA